jgi:glycosyltransferase involved in cell wall biosynthesis
MISFIIPTYNLNTFFLKRCVNSILSQRTNKEFEIIIIDDFSPILFDESLFLNNKIKILKNDKNYGISYSINRGIKASRGKYICWISYDDYIFSSKLEIQLNYMNAMDLDFSYHSYFISFEKNNFFKKNGLDLVLSKNPPNSKQLIKKECFVNGSTTMIKKDFFEKIGLFNPDLKFNQDWDFWIRAINKNDNTKYFGIPNFLGVRTEHESNLSNKILKKEKESIDQKIKENNIMGV